MKTSFYSSSELSDLGFKSIGKNVLISRFAQFYNTSDIEIGNNVRIDDFCIVSGEIKLASNIHIAAYCALYGRHGIEMMDYTGLSPRCTLFSSTDDFSGDFLISPMVPPEFTNVIGGKIFIQRFSQIGAGAIVMPAVNIHEGVAVGAMSLVKKDLEPWSIYAGVPAMKIKDRNKGLLKFI